MVVRKKDSINQLFKETFEFLSPFVHVDRIVLFGSYAYGQPHEYSDIDAAVVSENFEAMNILDKIDLLAKVGATIDCRLELLGFSAKDYSHPDRASFLEFIKKQGKEFLPGRDF